MSTIELGTLGMRDLCRSRSRVDAQLGVPASGPEEPHALDSRAMNDLRQARGHFDAWQSAPATDVDVRDCGDRGIRVVDIDIVDGGTRADGDVIEAVREPFAGGVVVWGDAVEARGIDEGACDDEPIAEFLLGMVEEEEAAMEPTAADRQQAADAGANNMDEPDTTDEAMIGYFDPMLATPQMRRRVEAAAEDLRKRNDALASRAQGLLQRLGGEIASRESHGAGTVSPERPARTAVVAPAAMAPEPVVDDIEIIEQAPRQIPRQETKPAPVQAAKPVPVQAAKPVAKPAPEPETKAAPKAAGASERIAAFTDTSTLAQGSKVVVEAVLDRIRGLGQLLDEGLIDRDEFHSKKKELLSRL